MLSALGYLSVIEIGALTIRERQVMPKVTSHRYLYIWACLLVFGMAPSAYAETKTKKTVIIDKESLAEKARGRQVLSGRVKRVGHEVLFIETEDGRKKIDVDDIDFPAPLDELFDEETTVIATGRIKGDKMIAHRIVAVKNGNRKAYISKKPIDITIKGEDDIKIRVNP